MYFNSFRYSGAPKQLDSGSVGAACDVTFTADCVFEHWRRKVLNIRRIASLPANSISSASSLPTPLTNRPPNLFVKFKFSQLHNAVIQKIGEAEVKAYVVLTGDKHALFLSIRRAFSQTTIHVWHYEIMMKGRFKVGGKLLYLNKP